MKFNFSFFGPALTAGYLLCHLYLLLWARRYFSLSPKGTRVLGLALALAAGLFPVGRHLDRAGAGPGLDALVWAGYVWLGAALIWSCVLLLCDLLMPALRRFPSALPRRPAAGAAALGLAAFLVLHALWRGLALPEPVVMEIRLKGLPAALDGFRVVQVSDTHLGRLTSAERFRRIAERMNSLEPDLVAFTGDISDRGKGSGGDVCAALGAVRARRGVIGVLGNHDSFRDPDKAAEFFSGCGIRMLRYEVFEPVPGLQAAGVDDRGRKGAQKDRVEKLAAIISSAAPVIFLTHRAEGFEPVAAKAPALVLAGHTHEGQLYPVGLAARFMHMYFYGLYEAGGARVYVTSGAGTWGPPMRLFTRSELPVFILRPEAGE